MKDYTSLKSFLDGAIVLAAWAIALFFFRFWKSTSDRLFGYFAAAFVLLGVENLWLAFLSDNAEARFYLIRLLAFLLILFAILDKNRKEKKP